MADVAALKHRKPQSTSVPTGVQASLAVSPAPVFAMLTDRGQHRQTNQDACAALPELGVFVVCDGMGGAAAGDVASQLACQSFLDCIAQSCCPPPLSISPDSSATHPLQHSVNARPRTRLCDAVRAANQAVFRHSRTSSRLNGMGTTLVALLWERSTTSQSPPIWLAHVGDSRCYRLRAGVLEQLTEDHSLVEEQVRAGVLNRVQATASPMRNIITRAIGARATVEAAIATHATLPGDLYLLTSDGLTRELDDAEIAAILTRTAIPALLDLASPALAVQSALDTACHELVYAANAHGGRDNITVLLVPCLSPPSS
jgi:protein phosphatase